MLKHNMKFKYMLPLSDKYGTFSLSIGFEVLTRSNNATPISCSRLFRRTLLAFFRHTHKTSYSFENEFGRGRLLSIVRENYVTFALWQ